ncbi:hypothetical protein E2562_002015 [Oryza meyeriana var. granulata]|uniref:F-box domain-containing protein n=1 Tax=Oryza meyeriana var. granulata TaxID=110450 RepID=A0A6G1C436_9ORYZ|nr:hypothetical protein E2562_002015 [Oryza meyeriana var. granulata]
MPFTAGYAGADADRIGTFPDDILHHLLSLLLAHEAVWMCVLGRCWRNVWRSTPAVHVTGARGWDSAAKFSTFLDSLLRLRRRTLRRSGNMRLESVGPCFKKKRSKN